METPNLTYIYNLSQGDKEFENKMIKLIQDELPKEIKVYHNNLKSKNYIEAAGNVHKFKHTISILGLEKSYDIAIAYENELKNGNTTLSKSFDNILTNMINYINKF